MQSSDIACKTNSSSAGGLNITCANTRGKASTRRQIEALEASIFDAKQRQDLIFLLEADMCKEKDSDDGEYISATYTETKEKQLREQIAAERSE